VSEEKRKRRSKKTVVEGEVISGVRKVRKIGYSYYVTLPKEFLEKHGLKEGDTLTFIGKEALKFMPVKDD